MRGCEVAWVSLREVWRRGISLTGLLSASNCVVADDLISALHVYPIQPNASTTLNIVDLHVHASAMVYSYIAAPGSPAKGYLEYVSAAQYDPPGSITSVADDWIRLFGVPGDARFYSVYPQNLPHSAKFHKSETDAGTTCTFPTSPTTIGTIEAMYVFRNVGYASTQNYALLKTELGVPTNFAHATSIFDFGYPASLALCDGFEPYALIGTGAYWVNFAAGAYARFIGHFPTSAPFAGMVNYGRLLMRYMAAKNGAFFLTSAGHGVFLENREPVPAAPGSVYLLNQLARALGRGISLYIYVNAHFPYWAVLLASAAIAWETGNWVETDVTQDLVSRRGPLKAILVAGDLRGVRMVVPLTVLPTGWPYVYNASVFLPYGPRIYAFDLTGTALHAELLSGTLLESERAPDSELVFLLPPELLGTRIRRVAVVGRGLRSAEVTVSYERSPGESYVADIPISDMSQPAASNTGLGWSDGAVVVNTSHAFHGELMRVKISAPLAWVVSDIALDVEPAELATARPEPYTYTGTTRV